MHKFTEAAYTKTLLSVSSLDCLVQVVLHSITTFLSSIDLGELKQRPKLIRHASQKRRVSNTHGYSCTQGRKYITIFRSKYIYSLVTGI